MSKKIAARLALINSRQGVVTVAMLAAAGAARADAIDVSASVTSIGSGLVAVAALGAAFLAVTVLKKLWSKLGG
jgi:hypothetical protein